MRWRLQRKYTVLAVFISGLTTLFEASNYMSQYVLLLFWAWCLIRVDAQTITNSVFLMDIKSIQTNLDNIDLYL